MSHGSNQMDMDPNGLVVKCVIFILVIWKGPRPKLKAVATQVWVPTHSLKTSDLWVLEDSLCSNMHL